MSSNYHLSRVTISDAMKDDVLQECLGNRTPENVWRIVEGFMPMIRGIASGMQPRAVGAVGVEDLIQEGCIAVLHAAKLYDASRGVKFITYAYKCAWGGMKRYWQFRSGSIHLPLEVVRAIAAGKAGSRVTSQATSMFRPSEINYECQAREQGDLRVPVDNKLDYHSVLKIMEGILPLRTCEILWMRSQGVTMDVIGRGYGLSRERVRQIEVQGLRIMRIHFGEEPCRKFTGMHVCPRIDSPEVVSRLSIRQASSRSTTTAPTKTRMSLREYWQKQRESRHSSSHSPSAR